jgi:hypothetical protein
MIFATPHTVHVFWRDATQHDAAPGRASPRHATRHVAPHRLASLLRATRLYTTSRTTTLRNAACRRAPHRIATQRLYLRRRWAPVTGDQELRGEAPQLLARHRDAGARPRDAYNRRVDVHIEPDDLATLIDDDQATRVAVVM